MQSSIEPGPNAYTSHRAGETAQGATPINADNHYVAGRQLASAIENNDAGATKKRVESGFSKIIVIFYTN